MLRGKGPHRPEYACDLVRINSLMIYTELMEYNIVGDTKAPLLRCLLFISKLKSGDIITSGQYMNYQTFCNLQFRQLLKNSFHSIHIDLRDTSGEMILFASVGITRPVLMFTKASNVHVLSKRRYKMVASRQIEIPFYKDSGRQCVRGFGALAQVIGRTAIPFLRKYIFPPAKRVVTNLSDFPKPKIAEVVKGAKNIKTAAKSMGRQTLRKQLGSGSRKRSASSPSDKICKRNQSVAVRHFQKHFSLIMSSNFRYQHFVAVSGNPGGKVPVIDDVLSSHEHDFSPTNSLDGNCIEFEIQTDRNCYVDLRQTYLVLKLKIVRGRGYKFYTTIEVEKGA